MHFSKDLYISQKLIDKKKKVLSDIKYGRGFKSYYLIYKNQDSDRPEFMKSIFFKQKYLSSMPIEIIGVIDNYDDALEYIAKLTAASLDVIYDD